MGKRRDRFIRRQVDQATARSVNGPRKAAERKRRDARMRTLLQKAKPPYVPAIRNWLVLQLDKPADKITPQDVQKVLAAK
jgi:hypothetical protein